MATLQEFRQIIDQTERAAHEEYPQGVPKETADNIASLKVTLGKTISTVVDKVVKITGQVEALRSALNCAYNKFAIIRDTDAVYQAVSRQHAQVLAVLLEVLADAADNTIINTVSTSSQLTPLMLACYLGDQDCVLTLLQYGADTAVTNQNEQTAVEVAETAGHPDIVAKIALVHTLFGQTSIPKGRHASYLETAQKSPCANATA